MLSNAFSLYLICYQYERLNFFVVAQTTDVNEKEAWADAQVEEINKEFCIKQRQVLESM